ncbi:MAG: hypothetical protein Q8K53_00165, partial [Daejeonella sp.]|nr:hypothetical protein [Daejeonella sp.]
APGGGLLPPLAQRQWQADCHLLYNIQLTYNCKPIHGTRSEQQDWRYLWNSGIAFQIIKTPQRKFYLQFLYP